MTEAGDNKRGRLSMATSTRYLNGVEVPATGDWQIDRSHSGVGFTARHLVVSKVRGGFKDFSGTIHVAEIPEDSWVNVEIDAASLDTGEPQRDAHVRSADFLDVKRFPRLTFRSTKVERDGAKGLRVTGDLTIRDVTRPVELAVEYGGAPADPYGQKRAVFSASTEIDREEFGITWNVALEAGGVLVGKRVSIDLEIQATPAALEQAA